MEIRELLAPKVIQVPVLLAPKDSLGPRVGTVIPGLLGRRVIPVLA